MVPNLGRVGSCVRWQDLGRNQINFDLEAITEALHDAGNVVLHGGLGFWRTMPSGRASSGTLPAGSRQRHLTRA
jgi:hypothetical protein